MFRLEDTDKGQWALGVSYNVFPKEFGFHILKWTVIVSLYNGN